MKKNKDIDLLVDIWNLLEQLQTLSSQYVYDNQEFYIDLLKLLFNKEFRQTIKTLRQRFDVPEHWYHYPTNTKPHHKELFYLQEKRPDAPKKPTDDVIVEVCATFGLNPLRYGWFVIHYLYYGDLSIGRDKAESLTAKGEYRHKARIVIKRDNGEKKESFEKQKLIGYIQFFSDTTPNGIEEFVRNNMEIITNLQKVLAPYPQEKLYDLDTCKRDIEIFLLSQLGLTSTQIVYILNNKPTPKGKEIMRKSFETLTDKRIALWQRKYPIENRQKENVYHTSAVAVRVIRKAIKHEILGENNKSVKKVDP